MSESVEGSEWFVARWRWVLVALGAFAVAAAVHGGLHVLHEPGRRPVPSVAAVPWVMAALAWAGLLVSTVVVMRRARGALAKLGAVALHGLVGLVGTAGVLASDPAFPFGPVYVESIVLPGDRGHAYLYEGGLFCSRTVWRAAPGQWWIVRDGEAGAFACGVEARLEWDGAQERLRVVGRDGRSLGSPPGWDGLGEGLDWRPH